MPRIVVDPGRSPGDLDRNVFGGFWSTLGRCIYGGLHDGLTRCPAGSWCPGLAGRWFVSAHPTRPGRSLVTVSRGNR